MSDDNTNEDRVDESIRTAAKAIGRTIRHDGPEALKSLGVVGGGTTALGAIIGQPVLGAAVGGTVGVYAAAKELKAGYRHHKDNADWEEKEANRKSKTNKLKEAIEALEEAKKPKQFKSQKALKGYKKETLGMVNAHRQMTQGKKFNEKAKSSKQRKASDEHALRSAIDSAKAMGMGTSKKKKPAKKESPAVVAAKSFRDRLKKTKSVTQATKSAPTAAAAPKDDKSFKDRLSTHKAVNKPVPVPKAKPPVPEPAKPAQGGFDPTTVKLKHKMSPEAERIERVRRMIINPSSPRPRMDGRENDVHVDEFIDHASSRGGHENWIGLHNIVPMIKSTYHKDLMQGEGKNRRTKRKVTREAKRMYAHRLSRAHNLEAHFNPEHVPPGIVNRLSRIFMREGKVERIKNLVGLQMEIYRAKSI